MRRQIATGSTSSAVFTPNTVDLAGQATAIGLGSYTSRAILTNGPVKCWADVLGTSSMQGTPTTIW